MSHRKSTSKIIQDILLGKHDQSFPKFRLTGTAPSGDVHPVQFETELLNVEAAINAGVFLCTEPGLKLSTTEEVRFLQGVFPAQK